MSLKEEAFHLLGPEFVFGGMNFPEEQAKVIIYGVPLDATTCEKPGARFGPNAIREISFGLGSFVQSKGINYFDKTKTHDLGDVKVEHGDVEETMKRIEELNRKILERKKIPCVLGGEHSITYGSLKAFEKEKPLIIHFDAHPDLLSGERLHHGTWLRKAMKFIPKENVFQLGIRNSSKEEYEFIKKEKIKSYPAEETRKNLSKVKKELSEFTKGKKFYLSIDIDVLDMKFVPGTGTPAPGGLSYVEVIDLISSLKGKLVGMDLVEVAPDEQKITQTTAASLLYEIVVQDFI
ncbi:MAG: agmatinase [archaeon]|nr:agmatinase [Candidatus Micrarchaeota archaeon]